MESIIDKSIRSQLPSIRRQCSQIFLQFLLYYPIGEVRLQQHLTFLVNNLSFTFESGRKSVLDTIASILEKFPSELVDKHAEFFFFPLVTQVVNEESVPCKVKASKCIKLLIHRTSKCNTLLDLTLRWFFNDQSHLKRTGLSILGLFLEDLPKKVDSHLQQITENLHQTLTNTPENQWETIYLCFNTFEKMIHILPNTLKLDSGKVSQHFFKLSKINFLQTR